MGELSEAADRLCERAKHLEEQYALDDPRIVDEVATIVTVLREVALALDPLSVVRCEEQDEPH
jgi:hypothetical protein